MKETMIREPLKKYRSPRARRLSSVQWQKEP